MKIPPDPIALAMPIDPWVTARENPPVPISVGAETRAILLKSWIFMLAKGSFAQKIHRTRLNARAHKPIVDSQK